MNIDYYEILGLQKTAGREEIKQAYRTLSKKYHPDVNDANNASAMFRLVGEAYQTLYNDDKRKEYDNPHKSSAYTTPSNPGNYAAYTNYDREKNPEKKKYKSKQSAHKHTRKYNRARNIGASALSVTLKIVLFPIFVLVAFLEKVFILLGALASAIGWIVFVVGIAMVLISFFMNASFYPEILSGLLIAFIGFVSATLSAKIPSIIMIFKDFLHNKVFY